MDLLDWMLDDQDGLVVLARLRKQIPSVPVILITYATTELLIRNAVAAIAEDGVLDGPPQVIRIER